MTHITWHALLLIPSSLDCIREGKGREGIGYGVVLVLYNIIILYITANADAAE